MYLCILIGKMELLPCSQLGNGGFEDGEGAWPPWVLTTASSVVPSGSDRGPFASCVVGPSTPRQGLWESRMQNYPVTGSLPLDVSGLAFSRVLRPLSGPQAEAPSSSSRRVWLDLVPHPCVRGAPCCPERGMAGWGESGTETSWFWSDPGVPLGALP